MPSAIESVINFLSAKVKKGEHAGPDLIERFLKYGCDMEVQVNVAAGEGEPVAGMKSTYTDGTNQWFSYRIPKFADSDPEFRDFEMTFPLDIHCDGIGSTGWNWKSRQSIWCGYDFDSIVGHAAGVGVTDIELDRVREAAKALPYCEVRKSTGGAGLHFYVLFDDDEAFKTSNHTEHAALARCVLGVMSRDAGFDFQSNIDGVGGNMWLWHRKTRPGSGGLSLVKAASEPFTVDRLPPNWRDHIEVVTRRRAKVRLGGIKDAHEDPFDQLTTAHRRVNLDEKHKAVMDEIGRLGYSCVWIHDHHLLQTHTAGFAAIMERKEEFGIEGVFQTNSGGRDKATPNCFGFPLDKGGWKLYRFSPGVQEAPTWEQDGQGWTTCWFNVRPNMPTAAKALGGKPMKNGGFEFAKLEEAIKVAKILNPEFPDNFLVEDWMKDRKTVLSKSKDGKLAVEVAMLPTDGDKEMGQWNSSDKKKSWTQVINVSTQDEKAVSADYDNLIRCLVTITEKPAGWAALKADGKWTYKVASSIKMILQNLGHPKLEAEQIMGLAETRPWMLVSLPFRPEYPGNRQWNLDAPQWRYQPTPRTDEIATHHPHWDRVMNHVGADLTQYLRQLDWAKDVGIKTGADYLRAIFASILREPEGKTPYLFLFGPENSGKSILHEAFELLVTGGVIEAARALTNQSDFNGELEGAILCVVEEKNVSTHKGAHDKIKAAVTSPRLSVRRMRTDAYMVDNLTHWIQTANHQDACPVFDGDTRVTMIFVDALPKGDEVPKEQLLEKLREEAPAFMRTLLDMQLPQQQGRLRIPIVVTNHKLMSEALNRNSLEQFIHDNVFSVPGSLILYSDFYERFRDWLPDSEKNAWSPQKIKKCLPMKFPSGFGTGNKTYIINASFDNKQPDPAAKAFYVLDGKIKRLD